MIGRIHSYESFGTLDGPGIRFVVFFQGCPMRCKYCHNPDTWEFNGGNEVSTQQVLEEILKYEKYIKHSGGVTLSGGEPLAQMDFVIDLCKKIKKHDIHIAIDTSGINFDGSAKFDELIKYVDLFLLDIKKLDNDAHIELTKCSNVKIIDFATYLSNNQIPSWIRHVLLPNTEEKELIKLKKFINTLTNVLRVEVLPYHKLGIHKYNELKIPYLFNDVNVPSYEEIKKAKSILEVQDVK